ncbi:Sonic hedgehog protein A [Blattella germanica]|nr:Sonic hedgehog protein A [Blattella germanica]
MLIIKHFHFQRCKEKLNTLAISVMNQWPGIKLRVTEGWDEENHHAVDSLHYEGRAVDVTTSDRDRSKYGMLARLAVEAGFDWVYYESRAHIHCSVRSESSLAAKSGGCFAGDTMVQTSSGDVLKLEDLRIGDRVLALDMSTGELKYSEVILFLDRDVGQTREFLRLRTESGRQLTVTPSHLVLRATQRQQPEAVFAARVRRGDRLLVQFANATPEFDTVLSVEPVLRRGVYAPLTLDGTIVADGIVASCYAVVDSQWIAHWAYAPFRLYTNFKESVLRLVSVVLQRDMTTSRATSQGVHWYAKILYTVAQWVLPSHLLYE